MIIGWIRLAFFTLVGLSLCYLLASVYARALHREKLEKDWRSGELTGDRAAFINHGMQAYERGLKRRLLWLIYIVPMIVFNLIFFTVNWS